MGFRIPFTISNLRKLKEKTKRISSRIRHKKDTNLEKYLKNAEIDLTREEYLAVCIRSFFMAFLILFIISTTLLVLFKVRLFYLFGPLIALLFSGFVIFSQLAYPKIYLTRKQRNIEKNLIPGLSDILVQLNSGVPLFNIMLNISAADYGELSNEFKKAVKRINAGEPQAEVLDSLGKSNPSVYFRRTLWQISNGMRSGSDMVIVIKDSIKALSEEQIIQLQNYGNKLNPMIVLYMLISVIIPTLSITFLTIISSLVNLSENMVTLLFIALFVFVIFMQIMFLGLIKSKRPSLL